MNFKSIFLADDDVDNQEIFHLALNEVCEDFTLEIFLNGQELINHLTSNKSKPDILFLDIHMPVKDGIQTLSEIKSIPALKDLPVVMYSTSNDEQLIRNVLKQGATLYLVKTVDYKTLKQKLQYILSGVPLIIKTDNISHFIL